MEKKRTTAGIILIAFGIATLVFAANTAKLRAKSANTPYIVYARFKSAGLEDNSKVLVSGLPYGRILSQELLADFSVRVKIGLDIDFELPEDSTAAIKTDGLMGGKYLEIQVGGEEDTIMREGVITYTQDPLDLDDLIEQVMAMARNKSKKRRKDET